MAVHAAWPCCNPQPQSRYAHAVNLVDFSIMRLTRQADRKQRFLIVRGLIPRDQRLQISEYCTQLGDIIICHSVM